MSALEHAVNPTVCACGRTKSRHYPICPACWRERKRSRPRVRSIFERRRDGRDAMAAIYAAFGSEPIVDPARVDNRGIEERSDEPGWRQIHRRPQAPTALRHPLADVVDDTLPQPRPVEGGVNYKHERVTDSTERRASKPAARKRTERVFPVRRIGTSHEFTVRYIEGTACCGIRMPADGCFRIEAPRAPQPFRFSLLADDEDRYGVGFSRELEELADKEAMLNDEIQHQIAEVQQLADDLRAMGARGSAWDEVRGEWADIRRKLHSLHQLRARMRTIAFSKHMESAAEDQQQVVFVVEPELRVSDIPEIADEQREYALLRELRYDILRFYGEKLFVATFGEEPSEIERREAAAWHKLQRA